MKAVSTHVILCFLSAVSVATPAWAATYLVNPEGTGDFPTIQAAIDSAEDGDVIELADGYFLGEGNSRIDYLGKGITIRSRSGIPDACAIIDDVDFDGPICSFVSGEGPMSVLEGIGIIGGRALGEVAGVYCNGSSPTLSNCRISGNESNYGTGGMYCENGSSPTLTDCLFLNNFSFNGDERMGRTPPRESGSSGSPNVGGMACDYLSSPKLVSCTFVGNSVSGAYYSGVGALWCGGSATVIGCTFTRNSGIRHGAVTSFDGTFIDCTFLDNDANAYYVPRGAGDPGTGGGLTCGPAVIDNCTFVGNKASAGYGGGIYCGSGSSPTITNTIVAFSETAAGIDCGDLAPTLTCCDLFGNEGGDWTGLIADQLGINGNISEDPLFCGLLLADFTIRSDSPCAPFSPPNEECDLIGAWPVGCAGPTPTEKSTWGRIKATFTNP